MKKNDSDREYLKLINEEVASEKDFNLGKSSVDKYFKFSNNSWTVDFVGVIFKKTDKLNKTIISFPKYYFQNKLENETVSKEDISILKNTLINICKFDNESFELEDKNNFPVKAYLYVCEYFKKYGLYKKDVTKYYKGYGGQIDWKRTVTGSDKILNNKNLLFLPFINKKIEYEEVFITECMNYVLTDGYNNFGQFFNVGIKYKKSTNHRMFYDNRGKLIKKLVSVRQSHFKNIEIKLIDSIIKYIKWLSIKNEDVVVVTKKFELVWEKMINEYLNKFFNYNLIEGKIYFDKRKANNYNKFMKLPQNKNQDLNTKIIDEAIIDDAIINNYLLIDDKQKIAFLLESNYYNNTEGFNNNQISKKQALCYNILKDSLKKDGKGHYKIIEGLVLPSYENKVLTSKSSNVDIEFNKTKRQECYLKIKDVMKYYALKK